MLENSHLDPDLGFSETPKQNTASTFLNSKVLPWLICSLGILFYCYEFFLRVAPSVMTADIMRFYHIGAADFAILNAFYAYAYVPMQICVGLLMDHYGPRRLLCMSILCCVVGCFVLSSFGILSLGKLGFFVIGFGSAFAFVGVLKLAVNWLPPNNLSFVSGITTTLGLLGAVFAQRLLPDLLDVMDWRETWLYAGVAGVVVFVITILTVRDHPKNKLPEVANIPEASWKSLLYDLKTMIKNYKFIINGLIGCVLYLPVGLFGGLWAIPFFEQAGGLSHKAATNLVPAIFIGMAIGGPIASLMSEYIGRRKIFYQVSLLISLVLFLIIIYFPQLPIYTLVALLFALGLISGSQILVFVVGIELSIKEAAGTSTAATNFLVMFSMMILSPLIGRLLEYSWNGVLVNEVPIYSTSSYQTSLLLLPLCYVIALLLSFCLHDTHPKAAARRLAQEQELLVMKK
ncbi:MAG: MFS transporter [Gammaproteobacteria bacterium]|nr:MFS transporter [Gammaproteobacteria bacterium]